MGPEENSWPWQYGHGSTTSPHSSRIPGMGSKPSSTPLAGERRLQARGIDTQIPAISDR
jgi:hypothetical protein